MFSLSLFLGVANYSSHILEADLAELIQSLVAEKSNQKCILVAHDWGGVIAWRLAQHWPELVDRFIVLNAPHGKAWLYRLSVSWKQFAASWYMFFFNFPWLPEWSFRSHDFRIFNILFGKYCKSLEEIDVYKYYFSQPYGITGPLNYYRAMLRGYDGGKLSQTQPIDNKPNLVQPPTLIIWGRDDDALIPELAQDSAKSCHNAQVEYLDNCSHWIQFQRPQQVNEIMNKFLQQK